MHSDILYNRYSSVLHDHIRSLLGSHLDCHGGSGVALHPDKVICSDTFIHFLLSLYSCVRVVQSLCRARAARTFFHISTML